MSKISLSLAFVLFSFIAFSQQKIASTREFSIEENNKTLFVVSIDQLDSLPAKSIGNISTVNHKGEIKGTRKNVKGILLRDVLRELKFNVSKPKELFKYYFVLEATDNYMAVLSYNEIFNADNIFIITESNGVVIKQSNDRIEILSLSKPGLGHIYIKGLTKLILKKAD